MQPLKKERIPHQIHTYENDNFKITLNKAQSLLTDMLNGVGH